MGIVRGPASGLGYLFCGVAVLVAVTTPSNVVYARENCNLKRDVARLNDVLNSVKQAGDTESSSCSSSTQSRLGCPAYIQDQLVQDRDAGVLRKWLSSPDEACRVLVTRARETPSSQIERTLAANPTTSLGADANWVTSCLDQAKIESNDEKSAATAEYYLSMNRLRVGVQSTLEVLASIDSVLGDKILQDQKCSGSRLSAVDETCGRLQACPAARSLDQQAEELQQVWQMKQEVQRQQRELLAKRSTGHVGGDGGFGIDVGSSPKEREEFDRRSKELNSLRTAIDSMYPALEGKEFKRALDPQKRNFKEALEAQLRGTRKKMLEELESYRQGIECLNAPLTCGACENFEQTLAKAPKFEVSAFSRGARATQDDLNAQAFLGAAECRQEMRGARQEASGAVKDFAIGTGLTIATAGLGTIAAGAKVATVAVNEARAASLAGKAAQALSSARAVSAARIAILGGDTYFVSQGVSNAIDQCSEQLNQLSGSAPSLKGAGCPGGAESSQVQLMADYRACVLSALVSVGPTLLPFAPAFVKAYTASVPQVGAVKSVAKGLSHSKALASESADSVEQIARRLTNEGHLEWRRNFQKDLKAQGKSIETPRNKPVPEGVLQGESASAAKIRLEREGYTGLALEDGKLVQNINQSPERLIPALNEKLNGGPAKSYAAVVAGRQADNLETVEQMSAEIHNGWKKNNDWQLQGAKKALAEAKSAGKDQATIQQLEAKLREIEIQMGPYGDLPAIEKLKDVVVLEQALRARSGGKLSLKEVQALERYKSKLRALQKQNAKTPEARAETVAKSSGIVAAVSGGVDTSSLSDVTSSSTVVSRGAQMAASSGRKKAVVATQTSYFGSLSKQKPHLPEQPLSPGPTTLKRLDKAGCDDCPETIRGASGMNHASQHFWDHSPPRPNESEGQWLARRASEDRRKGVTTIFPPGITQAQVLDRATSAKMRVEKSGQNASISGKLLLDYVGESGQPKQGFFDVKIVICRTHCEPNRPGDVISIIPLKGPVLFQSR